MPWLDPVGAYTEGNRELKNIHWSILTNMHGLLKSCGLWACSPVKKPKGSDGESYWTWQTVYSVNNVQHIPHCVFMGVWSFLSFDPPRSNFIHLAVLLLLNVHTHKPRRGGVRIHDGHVFIASVEGLQLRMQSCNKEIFFLLCLSAIKGPVPSK